MTPSNFDDFEERVCELIATVFQLPLELIKKYRNDYHTKQTEMEETE